MKLPKSFNFKSIWVFGVFYRNFRIIAIWVAAGFFLLITILHTKQVKTF